jgi:hypothetical protein
MIQIWRGPQIHKKLAAIGYLIARESAGDLRYLCAGCA